MAFPLLRLPLVAIQDVLSTMIPFEIINLGLTSSRAKRLTQFISKTQHSSHYYIDLNIGKKLKICFKHDFHSFEYIITSEKSKDGVREHHEHELYSIEGERTCEEVVLYQYSEDVIKRFTEWFEYVSGIFTRPVYRVIIDFLPFKSRNKEIIDWLQLRIKSVSNCVLYGEEVVDEYVSYFLENVKITSWFTLEAIISVSIELNLPQNLHHLSVTYSEFMKLEHVLKLNCKEIILRKTSWSSQDITSVLVNWMSSKALKNLEKFEIKMNRREDLAEILNFPREAANPELMAEIRRKRQLSHLFSNPWGGIYQKGGWSNRNDLHYTRTSDSVVKCVRF